MLVLALGWFAAIPALAQGPDIFAFNRRLGRGVNILGYDPLWTARDQARFQEAHFRLLKEAGFQSVRVNLHAFRHMDASRGWALSPQWYETLDWVVEKAHAQGLTIILDFHEFNAMGEDAAGHKEQFLAFWRQVAEHFRNAPDSVCFEILNEPNKTLTVELWNAYLREALAIIRARHPTRPVIIGPASWNSVDALKSLELPADDRQLIVTVHYYKPMTFTHQGAPWTKEKDRRGIAWGTEADRAAVRQDFERVNAWAQAQKRPIFLGEFGAYDKAPMESRVRYTDAVARTAESLDWSWAFWQFDSDFVLWDMGRKAWVEPIRLALIPPRRAASGGLPPGYRGVPFADDFHRAGLPNIPGLVSCALFDLGGEGVAYHDTDALNNGSGKLNLEAGHQRAHAGEYIWHFRRDEGVDLSFVKDWADLNHTNLVSPPLNLWYIGWTEDGEWCNYTVNVQQPGWYRIRCLYGFQANTVSFDLNGKPAAKCRLPVATASYHHWNLGDIGRIQFPEAGPQLLTFHYGKGNNFAYFEFVPEVSDAGATR